MFMRLEVCQRGIFVGGHRLCRYRHEDEVWDALLYFNRTLPLPPWGISHSGRCWFKLPLTYELYYGLERLVDAIQKSYGLRVKVRRAQHIPRIVWEDTVQVVSEAKRVDNPVPRLYSLQQQAYSYAYTGGST